MRTLRTVFRYAALASLLLLASCSKELIGGLNQRDMLDAQLILERAGIHVSAVKGEDGRYALTGPSSESTKVLALLADHGLPRSEHASVVQIFPGTGFVVTPFEQKARLAYALEQQLSQTLSDIEGVAEARVHVVLPEDNGRGSFANSRERSVLIKYRDDADIVAIESKSRALVVNGVRGLSYEDVSIVSSPALPVARENGQQSGSSVAPSSTLEVENVKPNVWGSRNFADRSGRCACCCAAAILVLPQRNQAA